MILGLCDGRKRRLHQYCAALLPAVLLLFLYAVVPVAHAHDLPFSYLNLHVDRTGVSGTCVVHSFDAGHDLGVRPETLLDPATAQRQLPALTRMLGGRLHLSVDGREIEPVWTGIAVDGQRLALSVRYAFPSRPAAITVTAALFPYDPNHQTFLNLYNGRAPVQAVLSSASPSFTYQTGSSPGPFAVMRRFVPEGFYHILIGPDHLLFIAALMLVGGRIRRLALIVSMFTVAHSITLTLAALGLVTPPARMVEPAIALTIIFVGMDTLLQRGKSDHRPMLAFFFGLIHGFGFASVLRSMDLPAQALGWSLFSFNLGVEVAQLMVVCLLFVAFEALRRRGPRAQYLLRTVGSTAVVAAGMFWFVQRLIYPPR